MNIIGRTTKDAVVNILKDGRKVVHFSIAVNDRYRSKGGEFVKTTTYYDCAYWLSEKLAKHLKKGTVVEVTGRVIVSPYISRDGEAKASLKCQVATVKIYAWPRDVEVGAPTTPAATTPEDPDDLPF